MRVTCGTNGNREANGLATTTTKIMEDNYESAFAKTKDDGAGV